MIINLCGSIGFYTIQEHSIYISAMLVYFFVRRECVCMCTKELSGNLHQLCYQILEHHLFATAAKDTTVISGQ